MTDMPDARLKPCATTDASPPPWAQALLQVLLRPSDAESIPGDLLEEYRDVRRPSLGRPRADAWYIRHVLSVLWTLVWPFVLAVLLLRVLSFPLPPAWNPSLVPAPGVSLLDAVIFLTAGYYGSQRTRRLATGMVLAGVVSLLGFKTFVVYAAVSAPGLVLVPFGNPMVFAIASMLMAIAVAFGVAFGAVGAAAGLWLPPRRPQALSRSSSSTSR